MIDDLNDKTHQVMMQILSAFQNVPPIAKTWREHCMTGTYLKCASLRALVMTITCSASCCLFTHILATQFVVSCRAASASMQSTQLTSENIRSEDVVGFWELLRTALRKFLLKCVLFPLRIVTDV